jgi:hypothetical protein
MMLPAWGRIPGRQVFIANPDGTIVAAAVRAGQQQRRHDGQAVALDRSTIGRNLIDVLGAVQPLTTLGAAAGVLEIPLGDGTPAFATVATALSNNDLAVVHPRSDALDPAVRHVDRDALATTGSSC